MPNQPSDLKSFLEAIDHAGDFLVFDTETTGLDNNAEICEISIVRSNGTIIYDKLIRPTTPISIDAASITGINNDLVKNEPLWADVYEVVREILNNNLIVTYNATFDRKLLHQSDRASGLAEFDYCQSSQWYCAMTAFAERYGEFNRYHGNYKWQRLTTAVDFYSLKRQEAHRAMGDALMTLDLVKMMLAEYQWSGILKGGDPIQVRRQRFVGGQWIDID